MTPQKPDRGDLILAIAISTGIISIVTIVIISIAASIWSVT